MMLTKMAGYNTIKAGGLLEAKATCPPPPLPLAVRTVVEVEENSHVEGAVNIPLTDLAKTKTCCLISLPQSWETEVAVTAPRWQFL